MMRAIWAAGYAALLLAASAAWGQEERLQVAPVAGSLADGRPVTVARSGIAIGGGASRVAQTAPVRIEVYRGEGDVKELRGEYSETVAARGAVEARATVAAGSGVSFAVADRWTAAGNVVTLSRKVTVSGNAEGAGFLSGVWLEAEGAKWGDASFLAPGLLYGDPTYDGPNSPGGTRSAAMRRYSIREDFLPAPLLGMLLAGGDSLTVLDAAPQGHSTMQETRTGLVAGVMIDERFSFGGFGANEAGDGGVEMGYWLPGTTCGFPVGFGFGRGGPGRGAAASQAATQPTQPASAPALLWRRRYNPVKDGFTQSYQVAFRFGSHETFPDLTRGACRWAWEALRPAVNWHDIDVVRRSLSDQLSSQVVTVEGRTGLPFIVSTVTGQVWSTNPDPAFYWRATMGFVGKNIEAADMLLRESERDASPRGQKMRQQALEVIATFIKNVPMNPPTSTGVNLKTGQGSMTNPPIWYIREATDDMRMLMEAYGREKRAGREHAEWLKWCHDFADWALTQQRADGSLPRSYRLGGQQVQEASGTTSYNVVPLFVQLSAATGDPKYQAAAVRAADYVWESFGKRGVFIGGAIDNPNITDKEAGMLSLEAFLALYEATHEAKWLERAQVAANFAETWMWIWNNPMPDDAEDAQLHWKKGVPTVGVQGITAQVAGHVDQFLDFSAPAYAKLYKYTRDEHYRDVARILLHNTKGMLALPGRLYGMIAPGWQQENWRMGAAREGRGFGTPEKWMPWVTTNHLYSIYGLEEADPGLFKELRTKP